MPASKESQEHAVERAGKIFAILRQATENGLTCPSNAALAERFGVRTGVIVAALHFLECNGMIQVARTSNGRVVTICRSGMQTASERFRRAA